MGEQKSGVPDVLDSDYEFIEDAGRLSESIIWSLLEDYYRTSSISAWNQIPFYPTSNPFIAEAYAEIILNFLLDIVDSLNLQEPLYILEMAAGTGCFSFYLLKELSARLSRFKRLAGLKFCYVMADFTEDNPRNWQQSPKLKPFVESGILKLGVFKPQEDRVVKSLSEDGKSEVILSAGNCSNPLIAIANYFFDSIKQDAFRIEKSVLFEARHRFSAKKGAQENGTVKFDDLKKTEIYEACSPEFYDDPRMNKVLHSYMRDFENASILFPLGAFSCIANLLEISNDRLLLISSDKGFTDESYVSGLREQPFVAHHGIFSYSVNYDAIRRYFEESGGLSLNTSDDNLSVSTACNYLVSGIESDFEHSKYYFAEKVDRHNLSNYLYFMQDLLTELEPRKSNELLRACLAYVQLCNYDPIVFCLAAPRIYFSLETINSSQSERLLSLLEKVRENFFSVQQQYDVFYWIGRIYYGLNRLDQALSAFADSMLTFGESSSSLYYTAACYEVKKDFQTALRCYRDTLRLEPDCEYTQAGIKRVEAILAAGV